MISGPRSVAAMVEGRFNLRGDSSKFVVYFDDGPRDLGTWSRATGLGVSWDIAEYRHGGSNQVWLAPGAAKYSRISLSRATCAHTQVVHKWLSENSKEPKVFSGAIQLLDPFGLKLVEWELRQFLPVSWKIADFDTKAATVVIETLELAHTGFLDDEVKDGKA